MHSFDDGKIEVAFGIAWWAGGRRARLWAPVFLVVRDSPRSEETIAFLPSRTAKAPRLSAISDSLVRIVCPQLHRNNFL